MGSGMTRYLQMTNATVYSFNSPVSRNTSRYFPPLPDNPSPPP